MSGNDEMTIRVSVLNLYEEWSCLAYLWIPQLIYGPKNSVYPTGCKGSKR